MITFGGLDKSGEWEWPRRRKQIASYREMCGEFRTEFLSGLDKLILKGKIKVGSEWSGIRSIIATKRWNVKNTYPTIDTSILENYLSRYINRVAISRNRFRYIKDQQEVEILYKDYRNQEEGKAAPNNLKRLSPMVAIHKIMQHVLPPYFQKVRYYGLHSVVTFKNLLDKIPEKIKRKGESIRTLFQVLNSPAIPPAIAVLFASRCPAPCPFGLAQENHPSICGIEI